MTLRGWITAIFEALITLLCTTSAIFSQCELAGTGCDDAEYDFYHGNWHFLIATVTLIVYTRCAHATMVIFDWKKHPKCLTPLSDICCLATLAMYSALILIFKENAIDLATAKNVLGTIAFWLAGYTFVILMKAVYYLVVESKVSKSSNEEITLQKNGTAGPQTRPTYLRRMDERRLSLNRK
jgi:hypothetical protein